MRFLKSLELKKDRGADRLDFACELKFANPDDANSGTIEGYGAVFNVLDNGGDIILPGSFKKSLADWKKRKSMPAMLWQHDCDDPIGVWNDIAEDDHGLKVSGELITDVPQGAVAYALMKRGAVKGLSIGYRTTDFEINAKTGVRTIKEAQLWEISPVTFPMNPQATVTMVKGEPVLRTEREWEEAFRDDGLSNREAKIAVAVLKKNLVLRDGATTDQTHREGAAELVMATRRLNSLFA